MKKNKTLYFSKRLLLPFLSLLMLFTLSACQSSSESTAAIDQNAIATSEETTSEDTIPSESAASETPASDSNTSEETNPDASSEEASTSESTDSDEAPAPYYFDDFALTALNGDAKSLYDYEGQLIILNFWATWCTYCEQEMPLLNEIHQQEGIKVVAIDVGEDAETVQAYIDRYGYDLDFYLDENNELASMFGVSAFPTSIFIGPDFEYYYSYPGMLTEDYLNQLLDAIATYQSSKSAAQ
jgi:thiol-disulfide isomerase/thioredoxin